MGTSLCNSLYNFLFLENRSSHAILWILWNSRLRFGRRTIESCNLHVLLWHLVLLYSQDVPYQIFMEAHSSSTSLVPWAYSFWIRCSSPHWSHSSRTIWTFHLLLGISNSPCCSKCIWNVNFYFCNIRSWWKMGSQQPLSPSHICWNQLCIILGILGLRIWM